MLRQVCHHENIQYGDCPSLTTKVSFISSLVPCRIPVQQSGLIDCENRENTPVLTPQCHTMAKQNRRRPASPPSPDHFPTIPEGSEAAALCSLPDKAIRSCTLPGNPMEPNQMQEFRDVKKHTKKTGQGSHGTYRRFTDSGA